MAPEKTSPELSDTTWLQMAPWEIGHAEVGAMARSDAVQATSRVDLGQPMSLATFLCNSRIAGLRSGEDQLKTAEVVQVDIAIVVHIHH